jgi:hypothetical protein
MQAAKWTVDGNEIMARANLAKLAEFSYPERFCKLGEVLSFSSGVHLARSSLFKYLADSLIDCSNAHYIDEAEGAPLYRLQCELHWTSRGMTQIRIGVQAGSIWGMACLANLCA